MNLKPSVAELQKEHIVMELECIDRMYLNASLNLFDMTPAEQYQALNEHKIDLGFVCFQAKLSRQRSPLGKCWSRHPDGGCSSKKSACQKNQNRS